MEKEKELREGLTKLVGGRTAEEVIKTHREGREVGWFEKRRIADEKPQSPLSPQEIEAIQTYLGISPCASSSSDESQSD